MTSNHRMAGAFALAGAAAFLVLVPVHLTSGTFDGTLDSTAAYVNDAAFTAALMLTIPALLALAAARGLPRQALTVIAIGQGLVAIGVGAGLLAGQSPDWFAAVGVPGNLMAFVAWIVCARAAWRSGAYARPVAILMAVAMPLGMAGAQTLGLMVLPAALWLVLGLDLVRDRAPRAAYATA